MRRLTGPLEETFADADWFTGLDPADYFDRDSPDSIILPITTFRTEDQANDVWETMSERLADCAIGPPNVWQEIDAIFEELALNAAQHSFSPSGCSATVESFDNQGDLVFVVGVADAGIGIPSSLRKNPEYELISDDQDAILRATESEVTGTMEPRGIGLYHVTERVKAFRGEMTIISGAGFLMVKGGDDLVLGNLADLGKTPYKGTIALVSLPIPHNGVTS